MADFYPVLSRAIAGLQDKGPEARRAIYDKAKAVLVAQLRSVSPPMAETDIARQRLALDDVIARIERDYANVDAPNPEPDIRALEPVAVPPTPATAAAPTSPAVAAAPTSPAVVNAATGHAAPQSASVPPADPPADEKAAPVAFPPALASSASSETTSTDRPRVDIATPREKRAVPWGKIAVAAIAAGAIGGVAIAAMYLNRDGVSPLQPAPSQQTTAPAASGPKISERVGTESAPAASQPPPATAPAAGGQPPGVAVAQRAVLYIEPTDPNQQPRAVSGRVSWRVEAQNPGRGQPLETVVRADIDIPDGGLALTFTIRRNTDAAFPASHIVGLRFQRSGDDGNGAVREAGVPQFKQEENERGAPLSAITSVLGENLFVSAMSRVPVELERNLELIRTRNWIDIPIRFTSGRRGIVAFEKGVSGDQRIAEGLRAWQ